jgi:hypothetical protein
VRGGKKGGDLNYLQRSSKPILHADDACCPGHLHIGRGGGGEKPSGQLLDLIVMSH